MSTRKNVLTVFLATVLAFGLAACGGGSSTTPDPEPTPFEMAMDAIAAADTAEAAQAAYDEVKDDVSATEGDMLQAAVDARVAVLATMARAAMQRDALMMAAGAVDTSNLMTQADIDDAETAIAALEAAIAAAVDVDDTSMYQSQVDAANMAVATAEAALGLMDDRTDQMTALSNASDALTTALGALSGEPTQAQIDAAENALAGLQAAIEAGADLTDAEKADANTAVANAQGRIAQAKQVLMAQVEADRKAEEERARMEAAAMAATAAKLYAGISAPMGEVGTYATDDRIAGYDAAETSIVVQIGTDPAATAPTATLSEDKDTMVADNHGWKGKRYAGPAGGEMVEAVVYSNVEAPTMGRKFGSAAAVTETGPYEYALTDGVLAIDTATTAVQGRIALTGVTRTAGTETFKFPTDNPANAQLILVPGSYHGVSGTFRCDPTTDADGCTASVAAMGFTLGAGTWTFKPSNAEARVMSSADDDYASYGWWLRKTEDGQKFTASAFVDVKGTVADASGLNALNGTATYMGGAAGKYALASSTGGMNDAGHFTARAMLKANFTTNTAATAITGTIDQFMGADGMARDWSVKLNGSPITDTGGIGEAGDTTEDNAATVWTIGGTAAAAAGEWTGALRDNGTDNVPKVATGTFYSEYGTAGRMVGAFGASKQ